MISLLDMFIIIGYIVILLIMGYFLGRKNKNQDDYFLAERKMPWLPIGLSIAATTMSANGFVGGPGWAYQSGIAPFMVHFSIPLVMIFILLTIVPLFYHLKVTSIYQYIELRLGNYSRILIVCGFFTTTLLTVSGMVLIPALVLQAITGWSLILVVPVIVVSAIIYTLLGGIKAVIWTDMLQIIIMVFATIFVIWFILNHLQMGFFETMGEIKSLGKLKALDFSWNWKSATAFWGALLGGFFMWLRFFGFDQSQVQRMLTAKSVTDIKRSFVISVIVMNVIYFVFLLIGIMLFLYFQGKTFNKANNIMIDFTINHLPVGVVGLTIAGIFAAAMSSIDSFLNSLSTAFVKDIYEPFFAQNRHQKASFKATLIITLLWGIIIASLTLLVFAGSSKSILDQIGGYVFLLAGPFCAAFLLAFFTTKAHDKGVFWGIIGGFILTIIVIRIFQPGWLWNAFIGTIITFVLGYGASLVLKSSKAPTTIYQYTVMGYHKWQVQTQVAAGSKKQRAWFQIDKYIIALAAFFIFQFGFLIIISF